MGKIENKVKLDSIIDDLQMRAEKFDFTPVASRFANEKNVEMEYAKRVAEELKRFLIMCSISKNKSYAIRGDVDEMWHMFIIFTRRYIEFCDDIAGKYLHHMPTEDMMLLSVDDSRGHSYVRTLENYEEAFGCEPPQDIWPKPKHDWKGVENVVSGSCGYTPPVSRGDCSNDCKSYFPPCCNKE